MFQFLKRCKAARKGFPISLAWILLLVCFSGFSVEAHPLGEVVQETRLHLREDRLDIEYLTRIGPSITTMLNPDKDGDGVLAEDEKDQVIAEIEHYVRPNLETAIDGVARTLTVTQTQIWTIPFENSTGLYSSIVFSLALGEPSDQWRRFTISDQNFTGGQLAWLDYYVHGADGISDLKLENDGRGLSFRFRRLTGAPVSVGPRVTAAPDEREARQADSQTVNRLTAFLQPEKTGPGVILAALGLAFLLGMTHALSPGHGKAMVAAYLIGSKGRLRDAMLLGGIVTFTHVFSVILLGLIVLSLSKVFLPEKLYPWLGAASGLLVVLVGFWMLASRALHTDRHHHSHGHPGHSHGPDSRHHHHDDHTHGHDFPHEDTPRKIRLSSLVSLGIAGGMVPCPTALVVLLASVAINRIVFGLTLIVSFSFGLAAVLMLIGGMIVTASKRVRFFSEQRRWVRYLPLMSAGVIMCIGAGIILNALISTGMISIHY